MEMDVRGPSPEISAKHRVFSELGIKSVRI